MWFKKCVPCRIYQPATPEQIDKWLNELPDAYKQPQKVWQMLQGLQNIYTLPPLDGAMILNLNLKDSSRNYEEHFQQTLLEHACLNRSKDLDQYTSKLLKTAFVNGLKLEISKALKIRYDSWDFAVWILKIQ
ncbi:hypothetical protein Q7C36_022666 [Tachysurus vachellii]|uniref:Uncharacterized protein n=1 Tax=Tachysurus vachellii TaxID=175792 RepID=A0AA88ILY6_TACVA|nr:hypothetical protein Q7C36_022666 [Tachysurus vachellii]